MADEHSPDPGAGDPDLPDFDEEFGGEFGPDPLALRGRPPELDPGAAAPAVPKTSPSKTPEWGIRSFFSFAIGLVLVAIGVSILVSELSPLRFAQPASIAVLAAGAVLFAALVGAPRRGRSNS